MKKTNEIAVRRKGMLFASAGLAAMALTSVATPAMAQDVDEDNIDSSVIEQDSLEDTGNAILVTGTRIRNPAIENLEPSTSVDDEYLSQRNFINAADALNELPSIRSSVTPDGNQGSTGVGVNFLNLYGLGSQRSLTLLNGRRVVSSNAPALDAGLANPGVQVDVNIIPTALVDRIDLVSIGGAPIYGSDAISGTINFILKDDYEGLELNATGGISDEGDAERFQLSGVFGTNFGDGRGNITLTSFYSQQQGVLSNARDFLASGIAFCSNESNADGTRRFDGSRFVNPNIGPDTGPGDGNPGFVLCPEFNVSNLNQNGVVDLTPGFGSYFSEAARANNLTFNPDGTLRPYVPGIQNRSIFELGGDSFLFPDYEQITSDLERFSMQGYANYDLTDNITAFGEAMYFESKGTNLVEQPGFNSSFLGGRLGPVFFRAANPLLTQQARDTLLALGDDDADPTTERTFRLERVNLDLANTSTTTENQLLRFVGGLRGDFNLLGDRTWNWEASLNYGRSKIVDLAQDIDLQNYVNSLSECRTDLDFDAFPGSGLSPIDDPQCVPVSLFGFGTASPEAIDYVTFENRNVSVLEQYVANVNVGGDLFDLFGNAVSFNAGYEFRREEGSFDASEPAENGRGIEAAIADISGAFEVHEVFGEVFVPLITPSNDLFIERLDVFGRGRYVENSINGGFFAWSAGGAIGFIPDITLRGNYTRSFRAPAVTELFAPQIVTRTFIGDFCSPGNRNAGAVPEIRSRNCAAFLGQFPNATPLIAQNVSVPVLSGGNPNLDNETADSFTFGIVLEPRVIPNLAITVDYIDIEIADPIVSLTAGNIAAACFDNEEFNTADPANGNQFCSLIRRDADGQVINDPVNPAVTEGFVNGALIEYSGIDATLNYRTSLDTIGLPGNLAARGNLSYVRSRRSSSTGVNVQRSDGLVDDPQFAGQLGLQYVNANYGLGTVVNYTGEQLVSRFNRGPSPNDTREFDQYEDFVTVDVNAFIDPIENVRVNFSVNNLFNRQGQEYFGILIPDSINDSIGRYYTLGVTAEF